MSLIKHLFVLITTLLVILGAGTSNAKSLPTSFKLSSITQETLNLKRKSDQPLLIQFWASWCHSCSGVIWDLNPIIKSHPRVKFMSISIDDNINPAISYIQKHALFKTYKDHFYFQPGENLLKALDISSVPAVFLINKKGVVLYETRAHIDSKALFAIKNAIDETQINTMTNK